MFALELSDLLFFLPLAIESGSLQVRLLNYISFVPK